MKQLMIIWLVALLFLAVGNAAQAHYDDGNGSAEFPYEIAEPNQLIYMSEHPEHWGQHFILTADVNMNLAEPNTFTTAVIAPSGSPEFAGVFDGNGYIISNLTIDTAGASNDYLGLFGRIESFAAEVKNLGLENVRITGGDDSGFLGGLCGYKEYGSISNCYSTGFVTGGDNSGLLGGLCGWNRNSFDRISNCYSTCAVTGNAGLGGLCGRNDGDISDCHASGSVTGVGYNSEGLGGLCGLNFSDISNCYATGSVTGGDNSVALGGLCGRNLQSDYISNCYATGSVTGGDNSAALGGLCGMNTSGYIINCYATGSVTGGDNSYSVGGLCGENFGGNTSNCYATGSVTGGIDSVDLGGLCGRSDVGVGYEGIRNCFWNIQTSGIVTSDGGTGLDTEHMMKVGTYYGWGLDGNEGVWTIDEGNDYPHLAWENQVGAPISSPPYLSDILEGTGESGDPYLIYTAKQLGNISFYTTEYDKHYKLTADINMNLAEPNRFSTALIASNFLSSSEYFEGVYFKGVFDGNNYAIYNLTINTAGAGNDFLGLFGGMYESSAEIKNLGLINIHITGGNDSCYLGGLCGQRLYGSINNCYANGSVTGGNDSERLGGLCGDSSHGSIRNCYTTVSVTGGVGSYSLGGLCGDNGYGSISNSSATGLVSGEGYSWALGGLCGRNFRGSISNCSATGSVTGEDESGRLGGLCGLNHISSISDCYATGSVTGGNSAGLLGGLCGENYNNNISNCYAIGSVTGGADSLYLGGLCGRNTGLPSGNISNCYSIGMVIGGAGFDYLGGLCGEDSFSNIIACYYLNTAGPDNGNGTPLDDPNMRVQSSFINWDFTNESTNGTDDIWRLCQDGIDYPKLSWQFYPYADFTCPDGTDNLDYALFAQQWMNTGEDLMCDIYPAPWGDGIVNMLDLYAFIERWLEIME